MSGNDRLRIGGRRAAQAAAEIIERIAGDDYELALAIAREAARLLQTGIAIRREPGRELK